MAERRLTEEEARGIFERTRGILSTVERVEDAYEEKEIDWNTRTTKG